MPARIFVLKPSSFGDIIHTLPAVAWIKKCRPDWQLSWLVNTEWAPLLTGNATLEEIILFPRSQFRGATGASRFVSWLRDKMWPLRPDIALDFQGLMRSVLIAKVSRSEAVYGLSDAREGAGWFYSHTAIVPTETPHAVERYLALASKVLATDEPVPSDLEYPLPAGVAPSGTDHLIGSDYVLLHPFSRGKGKSLTASQVEHICQGLAPNRMVVIAGRLPDGEIFSLPKNCINLLGKTDLPGLIWLVRNAAFVISVDSGPMHLAAALNRPLVSIHTWSDPRKVGPYRDDAWVWKNGQLFQFSQRHTFDARFYQLPPGKLDSTDIDSIITLASRVKSAV